MKYICAVQSQLRLVVLEESVAALPLFAKCDRALVVAIASAMTQQLYPHRAVILDNVPSEGLYLVKSGTVRVGAADKDQHHDVSGGQCFGVSALLHRNLVAPLQVCCTTTPHYRWHYLVVPMLLQAVARTDCELWLLHRVDFDNILKKHPKRVEYLHAMRMSVDAASAAATTLTRQRSVSTSISLSLTRPFVNRQRRANNAVCAADVTTAVEAHGCSQVPSEDNAYVVRPDDTMVLSWMCLLALVTFYNFIMVPLRVAFFQDCAVTPIYCLDYCGDVLYLADIVLRMHFLAYVDKDEVVFSRGKIQSHYLRSSRVYRDVLSVLPLDLVALAAPIGTLGPAQVLSLFRINRLLRLLDATSAIARVEDCLTKLVTASSRTHKNFLRLSKLIVAIFLIAHVFGCVFFMIANQSHLSGDVNNWADSAGLFNGEAKQGTPPSTDEIVTRYVYSVYWAVAFLTTVGYGDVSPVSDTEKLYNIALFIVGTLVYATVIVYLQDIVSELDVTSDLFKGRLRKVQGFLQREQVASDFAAKVTAYQDKLWSTQRGAQSTEIRDFLPGTLYAASLHNTVGRYLPQLFFVQKCDAAFQQAFLSQFTVAHFLKNDVVFRTNEAANKLYFIAQGDVSLVSIDLQTDTATAGEIMPVRGSGTTKRNSVLVGGGARRGSLQESPFKSAAADVSLSATHARAATRFSFARRSSAVLLGAPVVAAAGRRGSMSNTAEAGRKRGRRTSYMKVQDGFLGDTEFFTRSCYACSVRANTDCVLYEMDFPIFWALVERFGLQERYRKLLPRDGKVLHRNSTASVVQRLDNNMANKKMAKMMSVCITEAPRLQCILPTSASAVAWSAVMLITVTALAVCVPYFTAFPTGSILLQLLLDGIATVAMVADMYLRLFKMAVIVDGTLLTDPEDIYRHYVSRGLRWDILATLPLGVVVFLATGHRPAYAAVRCLTLLRLGSVSGWLHTLITALNGAVDVPFTDAAKRAFTAVLALLYVAHLAGCVFCYIGRQENAAGTESWIAVNELQEGADGSIYLRAYYWALYTLTTVGYGSLTVPTNCEKMFAVGVMLAGSIFNAMISALLSSMVESSDQSSSLVR
jgi:CRP-like cAMP-binding protein